MLLRAVDSFGVLDGRRREVEDGSGVEGSYVRFWGMEDWGWWVYIFCLCWEELGDGEGTVVL